MSPANKTFTVRICKHPVDRSPESVKVRKAQYRGQSIRQIVEKFYYNKPCIVVMDGEEVLKEAWGKSRVRIGCAVDIVPEVGWFWAVAAWAFWHVAVPMAFSMAFSYLGGKLFGQDFKELDEGNESQNYSWNPRTTQRQGIVRPRLYGALMVHGNKVAEWTDVVDDSEVLYCIVDHGDGPIAGLGANLVYLNDQPSGNYSGVTIQERLGTMSQTCMTGFEKTKIEYPLNWELLQSGGPLTFTTPNNFSDDLEFTLAYPNGLIRNRSNGDTDHATSEVKLEISERGTGSWSTIYTSSISRKTRKAFYVNVKLSELDTPYTCEHGKQYDLRWTKLYGDPSDKFPGSVFIKSVREVVDVAFTRPGRALIGVTALGTEQLSGSLDVKCIRQGRIVNVYNGASWNLEYSNNRAWVTLDALTLPVISGSGESGDPYVIERYEGIDPSNVDLAFFYEWAEIADTVVPDGKGGTETLQVCNYNVDTKRSVFALAYELAQVGRVKLYWEGSTLTGWIDAEVADVTDIVTLDNMMARSWKSSWASKEEMAGTIEIAYQDEDNGYERTIYPHSNTNSGNYTRTVSVESSGETRRSGAVRMADFVLNRNQLIRNVNTWEQHKDALRYKLGDVVRVQGLHYRVVEIDSSSQTITVDRKVSGVAAGATVYLRTYDDSSGTQDVVVSSYTVASVSGHTITLTAVLDPLPVKNDLLTVHTTLKQTVLRRIIKIEPSVDNYFGITAETYDATLYGSDANDPVNPNPDYVWPAPAKKKGSTAKDVNWENILDAIDRAIPPQPNTDMPVISNCTFTYDSGKTTVYWDPTDPDDSILFRYQGVTYEIASGSSTKQWLYWDPNYTDQFRDTDLTTETIADGNWPVHIMNDGYASQAVGIRLLHAGLILAGTIRADQYAELRQTMSWMDGDSCDATHPYTFDFKLPSELTAIISAKLSFRIKDFRSYSTAAASVEATAGTSGPQNTWPWTTTSGVTSGTGTGNTGDPSTNPDTGNATVTVPETQIHTPSYTDYADGPGSHRHSVGWAADWYMPQTGCGTHAHSLPNHVHSFTVPAHTHDLTIPDHTHNVTVPSHGHSLTFGIYEESNATNVHFHIDDGAGFGAASSSYNSDQTDIDITSALSNAGWKSVRFDVDARCRITAILEVKVDITA